MTDRNAKPQPIPANDDAPDQGGLGRGAGEISIETGPVESNVHFIAPSSAAQADPKGPKQAASRDAVPDAHQPYRILVERISEGALMISPGGAILYCNRCFADMLGLSAEQVIGRSLATFASPNDVQAFDTLFSQAPHGACQSELTFERIAGDAFPALIWVGPLGIEGGTSLLVTVTDLTARRQSEEMVAAARFAHSVLEQAADAIVVCDMAGRITQSSFAADRLIDLPLTGLSFSGALPLRESAPCADSEESVSDKWFQHFLAGHSVQGVEVQILQARIQDRHFLLSGAPLTGAENGIVGCIVTLTDITERKRAEEKQTVLVAELNHRVKNILAIVRSVAGQTVLTTPSLDAFKERFDGRLKALALAHDILTKIRWGQVELRDLVTEILAPFRGFYQGNRIHIDGTLVLIPSHAIVPLAMVFHELSTNAAKYGALSVDGATLDVTWDVVHRDGANHIVLEWAEHNVPTVAPRGIGFGSKLIARVVSYDLQGDAELSYLPTGALCRITFPVARERPCAAG